MKVISDRVSILKTGELLSIVILPTTDRKKLFLLFLWLLAWTVCGIIVFISYFKLTDSNSKLFIIIYLSFWFYFEYNIAKTFIWKKFGREKIWIKDGLLHYQKEINKRGRIREFNLSLVSKFRLIELSTTSFADIVNQSFWVKGGERIEFDSQSKTIRLGMQLSDMEARIIVNEINALVQS
jgi:hypothetical protein